MSGRGYGTNGQPNWTNSQTRPLLAVSPALLSTTTSPSCESNRLSSTVGRQFSAPRVLWRHGERKRALGGVAPSRPTCAPLRQYPAPPRQYGRIVTQHAPNGRSSAESERKYTVACLECGPAHCAPKQRNDERGVRRCSRPREKAESKSGGWDPKNSRLECFIPPKSTYRPHVTQKHELHTKKLWAPSRVKKQVTIECPSSQLRPVREANCPKISTTTSPSP